MAQNDIAITSAIEMDHSMSHASEAAPLTGDLNHPKDNRHEVDTAAETTPLPAQVVEGQQENLLYAEELGFLQMRNGPRYTFYWHPKSQKFDVMNEDVLHVIEEANLLEHLELLQVSRSNKLIKVRFDSEKAAQHFVDCAISLNGNSFAFWSKAQRRLRVSIHGVHPNISYPSLEYELSHNFGGILDIRRHMKQYKNKVYETGTRTFFITELYRHIPRWCRIFNRWCLVCYTGNHTQPEKNKVT